MAGCCPDLNRLSVMDEHRGPLLDAGTAPLPEKREMGHPRFYLTRTLSLSGRNYRGLLRTSGKWAVSGPGRRLVLISSSDSLYSGAAFAGGGLRAAILPVGGFIVGSFSGQLFSGWTSARCWAAR